jgi:hypothetical protein
VEGLLSCCPVHSCAILLFLWRVLSAGVLLLSTWRSVVLLLSFFWGLYHWQNCPTVHIDRDQTLEV